MRFRVATGIFAIPVLCLLVMIGVLSVVALQYRDSLRAGKFEKVEHLTEASATLIRGYIAKVKSGELTEEAAKAQALAILNTIRYEGENYVYASDYNHCMVLDPLSPGDVGKCNPGSAVRQMIVATAQKGGGIITYETKKPGQGDRLIEKAAHVRPIPEWNWALGTGVYMDDVAAEFQEILTKIAVLTGIAIVIAGLLSWLVGRRIGLGIEGLRRSIAAITEGRYDTPVATDSSFRELTDMAQGVLDLRDKSAQAQKLEQEAESLKARADAERRANIRGIAGSLEREIGTIATAVNQEVGRTRDLSSGVTDSAQGILVHSQTVAEAARSVSQNVDAVAAATEELTASIGEINVQISQMSATAAQATQESQSASSDVDGLSSAVDKIQEIVQLINDIASQTNLLALNATIEAARAGDAGKGFAVVASEVKNLATQTARATDEIASQIGGIVDGTKRAVGSISRVSDTIDRVHQASSAIAAAIEEQGAATQEIASNALRSADGVKQISRSVDEALKGAESSSHNAQGLQTASGALSLRSNELSQVIARFSADLSAQADR